MLTNDKIKYTSSPLTDKGRSQYCQLSTANCTTNMTKPEFSFEVCYGTTNEFPSLSIDSLSVRIYTDTSFNNFLNGGSQGGQIIFITDIENQSCKLAWN